MLKKKSKLDCLAGHGLSFNMLDRILENLGADEPGRLRDDFNEYLDIHTPYGPLLTDVQVPCITGKPFPWKVANPHALLYCMCDKSRSFSNLLEETHKTGEGGIVLYTDECTPGNQFRPDKSRETLCVYWTLKAFPHWYRTRVHGWMSFGFMKSSTLANVLGGMAALMVIILQAFFCNTLNFIDGIRLPGAQGVLFVFRAILLCLVQDEKAHKGSFGVKGASGTKFCLNCIIASLAFAYVGFLFGRPVTNGSP